VIDETNNLLDVGKTACVVFGEDQAIIYYHIKYAADIWNDLCVDPKRFFQMGRQTGGLP
jgi:hypothetical protein